MRQSKAVVLVLLGIVVGCAAERVLSVPPARAGTSPQKWEYACREAFNMNENDENKLANQFGQQGWELAAVGAANASVWCFKRPVP